MPSINYIQHKQKDRLNRAEHIAALVTLLMTCDAYKFEKKDGLQLTLIAYKSIYKVELIAENEFLFVRPLGDWLCSLPKQIWT